MNYPLLFSYRDSVIGEGFLAEVLLQGRLLASVDTIGWWLYGVNPGALAVDGSTFEEADLELRAVVRDVLVGFASEAGDFRAFRASVEDFFNSTNEPTFKEWEEAVQHVRSAKLSIEGLPRKAADSRISVSVTERTPRDMSARDNVAQFDLSAAA